MNIENEKYRLLLENMMDGYAYHQIIKDSSDIPIDYIFLDVNSAFEMMTGLAKDDIIGKTATEVLPGITESSYDWVGAFGQVALTGNSIRFNNYLEPLDRWYEVSAYSDEYGFFVAVFRDITDEKRVNETFVVSETRYRRLFESAKDGILILDAETGKIMNVNPFLIELLGYPEEEILGKAIWEIGTFKDIIENLENFLELQEKEYIRYENLPLQTANGRRVSVEFVSNVYLEGQRKVIQCNIRDITERKLSELYKDLLGEVLSVLNETGDLQDSIQRIVGIIKSKTGFNAVGMRQQKGAEFPFSEHIGFSEEYLREENSLSTQDLMKDICKNADASDLQFTPGGSCWANDLKLLHARKKSITQRYESVALIPIRKNHKVVGLLQLNDKRKGQFNSDAISALEEIANHLGEALARKQMEETLLESEQKLSSILDNIADVVWSLSLPDMGVFYLSPSVEAMYGRSVEEFINNPSLWLDTVHPDDQHLTKKAMDQLYETGTAERECRIVRPDGSIVWVYDKSQLVYNEKHVPVRIEGIAYDITHRTMAEESVKKRLSELESIYKISSALRVADTVDEMLALLLDGTLEVLDSTAGAICLYHAATEQLRFNTTEGWFGELDEAFLKPVDSIAGRVFASGKVLVTREYAKDSRMKKNKNIPKGWGGVCLPLHADEDIVGTIFISIPLPREINSDEIKLLTSLTEMAGTAIHRIGLFEKNVRHLEQMHALRSIDLAISGSLDLRVTYRAILDEVTRLLNVDAAAILRLDSHTGILKYEACRGFRITNPAKLTMAIGEGLAGRAAMDRESIKATSPREIGEYPVQGPILKKEEAHSYYAVPMISNGQVEGVLEVFHREPLETSEDWMRFLETIAGQTAIAIDHAEMVQTMAKTNYRLMQAYEKTIKGWAYALDMRDKETEAHSQRVTEMTVSIAREMGMDQEELAHVWRGALLHDIGKMGVPDTILLKPGKLTAEEWVIMRKHPMHAFKMLSSIEYLRAASDIPYCHHEKWDGTGYPRGLKGEEIPLAARIFAVVDVYDALISDRPYRKAWSRKKTLEHIREESGTHFDPQVVEMFFKEVKQSRIRLP